jgi:hypothetical protein
MKTNMLRPAGIAAGLLFALSTAALAQGPGGPPPPPGGGPGGGPGFGGPGGPGRGPGGPMMFGMMGRPEVSAATLPLPVLERTLSLTADQKTAVQGILDKLNEDRRAAMPRFEPGGERPTRESIEAAMTKVRTSEKDAAAKIEAGLSGDQKKKLADVIAEAKLLASVGIPLEVTGDLGLTADQKQKLAAAAPKERTPADGPPDFQAMQAEREALRAKVDAILTDAQKEKVRAARPRGGGGRRGGGFGGPGGGPGGPGRGPGGPGGPPPPPQF